MKMLNKEIQTTTFKIAPVIEKELIQRVIDDGLGMRGKSKWIAIAIQQLLNITNFPELVDLASDMENQGKTISIRLSKELVKEIDQAVIAVRKIFPQMEGVRSHIIRASIMQELLK